MPVVTCSMNRVGRRGALLLGLLALLLPTTLWAGGHTIKVRPPNGVDDTATIQAALDAAVASGPGTTVQLAAGRYLTQQLATYNFHGTFKGAGKDKTIIEALPHLQVNANANFCNSPGLPNVTNNRWPSLIIFVDGDIRISELSIKVMASPGTATTTWWLCDSPCTFLLDAIRIMGTTTPYQWVRIQSPQRRGFPR
jgi:Pectate lyase superfamily protein